MPSPLSNRDVPNWRTPRSVPLTSYRNRNASGMPALVCPGSVPSSWPVTYTPDRPTPTPNPASPPGEPYWRGHTPLASGAYLPGEGSAAPAPAPPRHDPPPTAAPVTPRPAAAPGPTPRYAPAPHPR